MNFLFGKKKTVQALAEVLEDGREKGNREMNKAKYNNYEGNVPMIDLAVRVLPADEPPFEAVMRAGITHTFLLKPGVRVQVKYDPSKKQKVELNDEHQAILDRNPQLLKKQP